LPDFDPSILVGDLADSPALQKAPQFIKDALIFPYFSGLKFSAAILKPSGWSGLPGVFSKPPLSTQQILHPAQYRSGKAPAPVALPSMGKMLGSNWVKLEENTLGEFGWQEVLKQFLGDERAKPLSSAWDGDRYIVYEQKHAKRLLLVTRVRLNSEEMAVRFFGQYSEALERKYAERSNLFRRANFFSFDTPDGGAFLDCWGFECVTMEGTTRNMFDGLTRALAWPSVPQPPPQAGAKTEKTARAFPPMENGMVRLRSPQALSP
jgi:hypothetical protein